MEAIMAPRLDENNASKSTIWVETNEFEGEVANLLDSYDILL